MAKLLNVIWSNEAVQNLEDIIHYIKKEWTQREVDNFLVRLEKCIFLIQQKPKLFPLTEYRKNLRRCVISRQTSLYYLSIGSDIYIVSLFDNRRNLSNR